MAKTGVANGTPAPSAVRLNPAASAAVRALASALKLPSPEEQWPAGGSASTGTPPASKPAVVPSPVPPTARRPPTAGGDPSPYAGVGQAPPARPPQAGTKGVSTPRAPASVFSRPDEAPSPVGVAKPPVGPAPGPVPTPPAPAAPVPQGTKPKSRSRLVLLTIIGALVMAGGFLFLGYQTIEARRQNRPSTSPGARASKAKSATPRFEAHFDRNAVADSLVVGDRLIAVTHSGALVAFHRTSFALLGERSARHKFLCIGGEDATGFSAGLSNGAIVKVKAADLTVSKIGEVPGRPEWIGRRAAGGPMLVVYSNPRRAPLGALGSRGFAHKLKDLGTGREYGIEAPIATYLDSKDRLWIVASREKASAKLLMLDLATGTTKEIAGKNAWAGLQGVSELADGQIWAFGGTSQPGGPASFIASVDATGKSTLLWTASERATGAPETPIVQIVTAPGRSSAVAISALDVVEVDASAKRWKPMGSTGLQAQVAAMRTSGRAHLEGERVIMGLATGGFLDISSGQAQRHLLDSQDSVLLPTEIRPMADGLAFYGHGGPLLYAKGSWRAVPETVEPPRDLMGVGHGEAGERVWASLVSIPVGPGSNVIVAKAGPRRWHLGHMHGMKDTLVTGKWADGSFKIMSQEDVALEPDDTFATPDGQLWNVDDQGLWNFSAGKWRMVMSMPAGSHGGRTAVGFEGQDRSGVGSVNSAVGEPLHFVAEVGPPWVGLPYGSFTWSMARLDLNEASGIPLIDEIPVSIDGRRVQIRDAISYGKGQLLLATNQGLCLFDLRWSNCKALAPKGLDNEVAVILRDQAKRVWLGGRGLWLLEDENRARPLHPAIPMLAEADILSMAEAPDGRLALGLAGRGAIMVDVPARWELPSQPPPEPWDGPGSFAGQFTDQALVIRPCKAADGPALQEQAQAFDKLRTALVAAVLSGNPRIHLGDEAALDRRADLVVYGPEVDKLESPVVAALKKNPLWNDLGISKRYGPRGSRTVDVTTCPVKE